jgi:hypothetical protein
LVDLTADADLIDGTHVSDTQRIRFAVGAATAPDDAFAATWAGAATADAAQPGDSAKPLDGGATTAPEPAGDVLVPVLIGAIALVAAGLATGFTAVIVRSGRAKRRVLEARQTSAGAPDTPEGGRS